MVTADRVKAKLQGLITAANTKTGNSYADLTTAVNTLIDGFGQGGVKLPEIDESVLGSASDLARGKQLIDADGNLVTGTLGESKPDNGTMGFTGYVNPEIFINTPNGEPHLNISAQVQMPQIVRKDARVCTRAPLSMFGDATEDDVRAGKTFTSVAGLTSKGKNNFRDIKTITIKEV